MNKHVVLHCVGLAVLCVTLGGGVARAAPSAAPGGDQFSASASTGGRTGTQGVTGNPNCAPPVMAGGGHPANWSCRTGTQSVLVGTPGAASPSLRQVLLGGGTGAPAATPNRGALLGQTATYANPTPRAAQPQMPAWPAAAPRPAMPSAGAGPNARLQAGFDRLNNNPRMQAINAIAGALGVRPLVAGPQGSTVGAQFGYAAQRGRGFGGTNTGGRSGFGSNLPAAR